ncbi:scavenger receptor cysteine-rich type 1 protein M130-like [Colossoma macropomum]|uniref:scavenger receptor cysteine-rich type 1 protein M130-like n=1 Tax=Colossoma macropomum TaxID=42526 RepID=UPI001864624F|nr:scavenger receptor cysteine-rich type 1 protein M130-like [Colossoma macropomum]
MELQSPAAALTAVILIIICSTAEPDVRLVGGSGRCDGAVELLSNGYWRKIYGDGWTRTEAAVVCRQLDCGSAVTATEREPKTEEYGFFAHCKGSESVLNKCRFTGVYGSFPYAVSVCSDSVRLVDGAGRCSGRLEVKTHQSWTTVCEADFDWLDAEVVCRELDCGTPLTLQGALFGEGKLPFGKKESQCNGTENHLLNCSTSDREENICTHGKAVGLTCSEVRLVNGSSSCAGTVEVFHYGDWRTVREAGWSRRKSAVVCRQLDCGSAVAAEQREPEGDEDKQGVITFCGGSESAVSECRISNYSGNSSDVVSVCSDSVRLVDGAGRCSGRLEVKSHQSWTTVCETGFDWQDAEVVCRELDCGTPLTLQGALFGEGKLPFGTKEFQCKGTENRLLTCRTSNREENTCTGGKAVGLTCSGPDDVRLVEEDSRCAGTVEMFYSGEWRKVNGYKWSMRETDVVCRQLGCGSAVAATHREPEKNLPKWDPMIECVGFETALRECSFGVIFHSQDRVSVICSGILVQPNISVSATIIMSRGLQGSEAFRGHSFTITCSTQPQYPGGSFYLNLPWSSRSHTQTAVNHSASFLFPAADDSHQGNYSCVYENQVIFQNKFKVQRRYDEWSPGPFIHNFSSESEPLSLIITDSLSSTIINIKLLVVFVMLFLMLITCLTIFLIFKTRGYFFIRNTSGAVQS